MYKCIACGKPRGLHANKKEISSEQKEWIFEQYLPNYDYQCGEYLCPDNDVERLILPNENWKEDRCRIEFRHNITCSSNIEVQVSISYMFF